jgi:hypothetical protein
MFSQLPYPWIPSFDGTVLYDSGIPAFAGTSFSPTIFNPDYPSKTDTYLSIMAELLRHKMQVLQLIILIFEKGLGIPGV